MTNEPRYPKLCATSFPAVVDYDFETNIFTRGKNNRDFRWKDVYIDSTWLFLEGTVSGNLESNTYKNIAVGTTGNLLITTGNINTTNYAPLELSGSCTVYVGMSGSNLSSSNLSGYFGSPFTVNPINGDESVGLWCYNSSYPSIKSSPVPAGASGVLEGSDHQVYFTCFPSVATGASPRLISYVEAKTGSVVLGYYNPTAKEWITGSAPNSYFNLDLRKYNSVKYKFTLTNLPFSQPETYRIVIKNDVTGSFVTVDDIHLDRYMKKNPFSDYILPTGYMIQISPDLGWHNLQSQLESTEKNPYISTLGPYSVELGNLVDNLDNSVTATIDENDFNRAINSNYSKYIWRAIPLAPDGSLGGAGLPEKFEFVGNQIDSKFSIDSVREDPATTIKTIIGSKSSRMTILVDGESDHPGIVYPTVETWKLDIHVDGSSRTVSLQGKDIGGATTRIEYVELKNQTYDLTTRSIWNVFDEHGVMLDLRRLPEEYNKKYQSRLMDVNVNQGGPTFIGVANGATRELDIEKITDAISLRVPKNNFNLNIYPEVNVEFGSAYVKVWTSNMVRTDRLWLDPVYRTVTLSKSPRNMPLGIKGVGGIDIPKLNVFDATDEARPSVAKLKVDYEPALSSWIDITYEYYETLYYKDYKEVGQLVTALSNLTDSSGLKLLEATLSSKLSGNERSLGLFIQSFVLSSDNDLRVSWSPIVLRRISDMYFREYFISSDGTYSNSQFMRYVSELRSNSRTIWGSVEADRDFWDSARSVDRSFDHIPTLFDPKITAIEYKDVNNSTKYIDGPQAWGLSYLGLSGEALINNGLRSKSFQPGVAHTNDLEPGISVVVNKAIEPSYRRDTISSVRNNNNFVIFSGQR